MSSLRIQDNLLKHVMTNGFKEGFNKQSNRATEETKKSDKSPKESQE